MKVSAKADYALRGAAELACAYPEPLKCERIAHAQGIPQKFLENILLELKHADLIQTQRGAEGGYRLARPPEAITLADVIRAVEGPLANVRGVRPEHVECVGAAQPLRDVWIAVRANLRAVLESVTLADIAQQQLPASVRELTADPAAWSSH
jgi:Rrf2 family protein